MATWVLHLRVAEIVKKSLGLNVDETAYYVGSIAPDSGRMVDNFTYLPSKDVSHWKREGVTYEQRFEDNGDFFRKYGENENNLFRKSFYLGYYVHILTDTIYVRDIIAPFIREHGKPFWRENIEKIRSGWYEIDHRFVDRNKNFRPLELIYGVKEFKNDFLDYFTEDDITERILFAAELYKNGKPNENAEFVTHDEKKAEELVELMSTTIAEILKEKHGF
jgi:hypothetical protein